MTRLPMKDALRELPHKKRIPITPRVSITRESEQGSGSYVTNDMAYHITYSAEFRTEMTVSANGQAIREAHHRAAKILVHEIYGPLRDDILEARHLLWEDGYDGPATEKLEEILEALR